MNRGHGKIARRAFEPIAQIGDIVALRGADGFVTDDADTPFYQVTHVETSGAALGTRGTAVVWCATDNPPAGYAADKASQTGLNMGVNIGAGATLQFQPDFLTLQKRQVMQFRTLIRALVDATPAALTGEIEDYDLYYNVPSATARFGTQRLGGVLNTVFQGTPPSDDMEGPNQGDDAAGTTNTQHDPFDLASRSELFVYGDSVPNGQIGIKNNGAAAASAGAIGLQVASFSSTSILSMARARDRPASSATALMYRRTWTFGMSSSCRWLRRRLRRESGAERGRIDGPHPDQTDYPYVTADLDRG